MSNLFTNYSVRGNLKIFKNTDSDDVITLSFGINANHQPDERIYEKINDFLEKLLIDEYHSEQSQIAIDDNEKMRIKNEKLNLKLAKEKAKLIKKEASQKAKLSKKKVAPSKSLY